MAPTRPQLPAPVLRYLRMFVIRRRLSAMAAGAGWAAAMGVWGMLAACALDRLLRLPPEARAVLLAANAAMVLWPLAGPLWRLARRVNWIDVARLVERENPALGQRLQTVVSQMAYDPRHRASARMLEELAGRVEADVAADRVRRGLEPRRMARAAAAAACAAAALLAARLVPGLELSVLAARHFRPWSAPGPVTRTRIGMEAPPKAVAGEPLTLRAQISGAPAVSAELLTSTDRRSWTRLAAAVADGVCEWRLNAPESDLWFRVLAGDADSGVRRVAVVRPPAVLEMRASLEYPEYARRPRQETAVGDAAIEVPAGTRIELRLTASEPLRSAVLIWGNERVAMARSSADGPCVWRAAVVARGSHGADLEMTGETGLTTRVARAAAVRVRADREPYVRVTRPADDGCAKVGVPLAVEYVAGDDHALAALWLAVQVNGAPRPPRQLEIQGDLRRQRGRMHLDAADIGASATDVLTISIIAADSGGRKATSEARNVLLVPGRGGAGGRGLAAALRSAVGFADEMAAQLEQAAGALTEPARAAGPAPAEGQSPRLGEMRMLAAAGQSAWLVHHALLRACFRAGSPRDIGLLAGMVDSARTMAWQTERWIAEMASRSGPAAGAAREAAVRARQWVAELRLMSDAAEAASLLEELEALRAAGARPPDRPAADRAARLLRRAEQEWASRAAALKISAGGDAAERLRRRSAAAAALGEGRPPDLAAAARAWVEAARGGDGASAPVAERLLSAAAVEALRPDSNPLHARDLHLAARAAAKLAVAAGRRPPDADAAVALSRYADAVAAVCREHAVGRGEGRDRGDEQFVRAAAAAARQQLQRWAGQSVDQLVGGGAGDIDDLVFAANAFMAAGERAAAEAIDRRLAEMIASRPQADRDAFSTAREAMRLLAAVDEEAAGVMPPPATRELAADVAARLAAMERAFDLPEWSPRDFSRAAPGTAAWMHELRLRALRLAIAGRLALSPALASAVRDVPTEPPPPGARPLGDILPWLRQWGAAALRQAVPRAAETEMPEYQEQLRIYFDAIAKAQERAARKN